MSQKSDANSPTRSNRNHRGKIHRVYVLLAALVAALVILPISRKMSIRPRPQVSVTLDPKQRMKLFAARIKDDPTDIEAYLELGKTAEDSGYFNEAVRRYYEARAVGASDQKTAAPLGRSLTRLARFDEAKVELGKAEALEPDSVEVAANLAGFYDSLGQPEGAVKALREFLTKHPDIANGKLVTSRQDTNRLLLCAVQAGDDTLTLQLASSLQSIAPDSPAGWSVAGNVLLTRGNNAEALAALKKAFSLENNEAALCYTYGVALFRAKQNESALKMWQRTIQLNPGAIDAYDRIGEEYGRRKDWDRASFAFIKSATLAKQSPRAAAYAALASEMAGHKQQGHFWRATAAGLTGNFTEALKQSTILSKDSDASWREQGLAGVAEAYRGLHKTIEYLGTIKVLAKTDSVRDMMLLAEGYEQSEQFENQLKMLRRALDKTDKLKAEIESKIASTYLKMGRRDEAEQALMAAAEIAPDNPAWHRQLGDLLYERRSSGDRLKRSISEFQKVIQLTPTDSIAYQHLGIAYEEAKDTPRAIHTLEHALDLQPGHGPTYQELARTYASMGDKQNSDRMIALFRKYSTFDLERQTLLTRARANSKDAPAQVAFGDFLARAGDYSAAAQRYEQSLKVRSKDQSTKRKLSKIYGLLGRTGDQIALGNEQSRDEASK